MMKEQLFLEMVKEENWVIEFELGYIRTSNGAIRLTEKNPTYDFLCTFYQGMLQSYFELSKETIEKSLKQSYTYQKPLRVAIALTNNGTTEQVLVGGETVFDEGNYNLELYREMNRLKDTLKKEKIAYSQLVWEKVSSNYRFLSNPYIHQELTRYQENKDILQIR